MKSSVSHSALGSRSRPMEAKEEKMKPTAILTMKESDGRGEELSVTMRKEGTQLVLLTAL